MQPIGIRICARSGIELRRPRVPFDRKLIEIQLLDESRRADHYCYGLAAKAHVAVGEYGLIGEGAMYAMQIAARYILGGEDRDDLRVDAAIGIEVANPESCRMMMGADCAREQGVLRCTIGTEMLRAVDLSGAIKARDRGAYRSATRRIGNGRSAAVIGDIL